MPPIPTQLYREQVEIWPAEGRHILAHYDDETVIVYQAYRPSIGRYAIEHGQFGGPSFGYSRMSWIKPNFLWMMYRSSWGTKEGQEITLALRLRRAFFDAILAQAVTSSYPNDQHATREEWKAALSESNVRLQWDPDHDPYGGKVARRAVQLGLRGDVLRAYGTTELLEVIDMSPFGEAQRPLASREHLAQLQTPVERVYDVAVDVKVG